MSHLRLGDGDEHVKLDVFHGSGCLVHVGTFGVTTQLEPKSASRKTIGHVIRGTHSLNDNTGDLVGVGVGGGSAVLEVTLLLLGAGTVDTDT